MKSTVFGILAIAIVACSEPVSDTTVEEGMEPPLVIGELVVGQVAYACNRWTLSNLAGGDPVLVDVFFGRQRGDSATPTSAERAVAERLGGRLIHAYSTPAVRMELPRASLPALPHEIPINHVRNVPDPARYDLRISLLYGGRGVAVIDSFEAAGGHILRHYSSMSGFDGVISDAGLREVSGMDAVTVVSQELFACLD